ncbi:MAG: sugar phosphate isomerase/epimerase [Bacteriovoracaceae bacterium]|nr:sugar phosphate isomerase/epimerase [Bacteriovoracaceae bacterium]
MRPITLFTGQWTDLDLETLAKKASEWGYDGLELACHKNHFDIEKAVKDPGYCDSVRKLLKKYNLNCWIISNHLEGQMVSDRNDERSDPWVGKELKGRHSEKNIWATERLKQTALAAKNFGVKTVVGFTGSSLWHLFPFFPPVSQAMIDQGYNEFRERWLPILDVFSKNGIRFAHEVHPGEVAYDYYTSKRALEALDDHPAFGFNFDPSHFHWQMLNPVTFVHDFSDRIFHVDFKDTKLNLDGRTGILSSHLPFGDPRRGWDFRSLGHGEIKFEELIRALNSIHYEGPLSVEWEDTGMDREFGAKDALQYLQRINFSASDRAFDSAFQE